MLKAIRKNTKVIIWMVVIAFSIGGVVTVGLDLMRKEARYAGEVFGRNVSFQEFDRFYRGARVFSFGETPLHDQDALRHAAWQNLIYSRAARNLNIRVTDEEVALELRRLLNAQGMPDPSPEAYRAWLRSTVRMEPQAFESQLREMLRIQKLIENVAASPVEEPSQEDIARLLDLSAKHLSADAALFTTPEEADVFAETVARGETWERAVEEENILVEELRDLSLADLVSEAGLSPSQAEALYTLTAGNGLSSVVPFREGWAVLRLTDKFVIDEESISEEQRQLVEEIAKENKRRERMFHWHLELMRDAGLKDYTAERDS